ncbi:serine peptidase [Streptomyces pseudogriseolus]|uniref:serine peptidase n=1 Tax=Streptomyces pseudogriseolus TaxID=36817 RepID=UPI003FA241A9
MDADELDDPLARELLAAWLKEIGAPKAVALGAMTLPLRYAASWTAEKFSLDGRLTHLFVRIFFREVAAYLRSQDDAARLAARDEVATRIAQHRPRAVIAHSLGTVVAYEALHAHPDLGVELFITLGSPLALPHAVFHRLSPTPTGSPVPLGARPASVGRWVNIADPGDPVAIPPRLARAFAGIALDLTTPIHAAFGFHRAKNYLACAATAATLGPYLGA